MNKKGYILMTIVGVIIIVMGIRIKEDNAEYIKRASTTEAIITNIEIEDEDNHNVYITYNVNNVEYNEVLGEYNSGMSVGQVIEIYYDTENPSDCRGKITDFAGWICIGFGIMIIVLAFLFYKQACQTNGNA